MLARHARAKARVDEVTLNRYADKRALARSKHARDDGLLAHWALVERTRQLLAADGFTVTIQEIR